QQKNALRSMFASEEWATSSHASKSEAKQVMNLVLSDGRFWKSITYCLKCVISLVKVLRLVDSDSKLAMPYIYEAMDRAKEQIAKNFQKQESRYHYDKNFNPDSEVLIGLYETLERMVPDRRTRFAIDQQLEKFKGAKGIFGMNMAIDTRDEKQPGYLFTLSFISLLFVYKLFGGRVMVEKVKMSWDVKGIGVYLTKRRNRLEQQRLNAFVFVKYNLQLEMRKKSREEKGDIYDLICLFDIESNDE
ncbi:hypothetical protein CR513_55064, partial [Mucuna pruriens]